MPVISTWGFECDACGTEDTGWDDYTAALRAEITHLEECDNPDAPECLDEARTLLAEVAGKGDDDGPR